MNVMALLEYLDEELSKSASVPLTGKRLVDVEKCLDIVSELRVTLPDDVKDAEVIVRDREQILADAQHQAEQIIADAQQRKEGKGAVVGCAGCYPTATTLAAAPAVRLGLVDDKAPIVVDAISGVTGAGKKATARTHFCFANENLEAYGVATHRHTPEIEQILGVSDRLVFTPHLAPLNRGLLSTVNLPLAAGATRDVTKIVESYKEFYRDSAFVTVLDAGVMPKTSSVVGTNCAHIGLAVNERVGMLIAVGAIDNLCKGAANQAVQCANIVFGLPEDLGLDKVAVPV